MLVDTLLDDEPPRCAEVVPPGFLVLLPLVTVVVVPRLVVPPWRKLPLPLVVDVPLVMVVAVLLPLLPGLLVLLVVPAATDTEVFTFVEPLVRYLLSLFTPVDTEPPRPGRVVIFVLLPLFGRVTAP